MKTNRVIPVFLILAFLQFMLYASFMKREVEWNYILHGDPTWYVYLNYKMFHSVVERNWGAIWDQAVGSPWGILLYLETLIPQFLFGPSRFSVGLINLIYFLIAQVAVYVFFTRLTRDTVAGLLAVILLLAMQTPFRGDGPGLNITDFHFDLVLFYLLIILHLAVAWSNSFERRRVSIAIGFLAGITVATRLVSFFLLSGVFGVFGLLLLYRWIRQNTGNNDLARRRIVNFCVALGVYAGTSLVSLTIGARALYSHYFRFIFDQKFIAERENLYVMGTNSKMEEAFEVAARMVKYDFGPGYIAVAIIALSALSVGWLLTRSSQNPSVKNTDTATPLFGLSFMLQDREAIRTYWLFLLISAITSYAMHVAFPIKSDHLTRLTAVPIYIAITILLTSIIVAKWNDPNLRIRAIARTATGMLTAVAVFVQLSFYTGPGRYHQGKAEIAKIQDLYADISRLVSVMGLNEIGISVDRITNFELGAMLSFPIYDFEQNDRFLVHHPGLGGIIDSPINLKQSIRLLKGSDIVLLGTFPTQAENWPFNKSIALISNEVQQYVRKNFCLAGKYTLFGEPRQLFVRPTRHAWSYEASASTEQKYGPEGLLEGSSNIWHAPWGAKTIQWVRFTQKIPVQFTKFTIVAQNGADNRAPRDFALEALDQKSGWVPILNVSGADFSRTQSLSWKVDQSQTYNSFRLVVSKNNGDPNLMTIQDIIPEYNSEAECAAVDSMANHLLRNALVN